MPTKYQEYLARKREKGEKKSRKTRPGNIWSKATEMALAMNAPVHECLIPEKLFERGLGNLVFSRLLPGGRVVLGVFLLDVFCLGVKNAFFAIVDREEYDMRVSHWMDTEDLKPMDPACFRKLVEGGEAYARELGFEPHADYAEARRIFGDLDASGCPEHFEYGHEGKPLYISGPNESQARSQAIVEQLQRCKGEGNYDVLVAMDLGAEPSV